MLWFSLQLALACYKKIKIKKILKKGVTWLLLPLNNIADFFHRAEKFAKVLRGCRAAASGGRTDLELPKVILQLVDGLAEGKFVPHLLDGVHIAHAERVEVFAGLQDGAVARHLFGVFVNGNAQGLSAFQYHSLGDGAAGYPLWRLAGFAQGDSGGYERDEGC